VCERLTRERHARRRALGFEHDDVRVVAVRLPVCETIVNLSRQMSRLPTLRRLEKPMHSAWTNYLI
jgi:hypothetical protein